MLPPQLTAGRRSLVSCIHRAEAKASLSYSDVGDSHYLEARDKRLQPSGLKP